MQAFTYENYGGPEVVRLTEIATPDPKPGEVRIKVHATTVSAGDWRARSLTLPKGMKPLGPLIFGVFGPRKPVLGTECSGVIDALGTGVTEFALGDAVVGFPGVSFGAHAEYICMPADGKLVHKPERLSFVQAAALPFGSTTAYDFLVNKAQLKTGAHVLVNGASGSTGSACVQLAKHLEAQVTAVCSAGNADLMRDIGADHVIDYTSQDFAMSDIRYDVIVDTAGTAPVARSQRALVPGGQLLKINGSLSDLIFGGRQARKAGIRFIGGVASEKREVLQAVADLAAQARLTPLIDRVYDFEQMIEAHKHVDSGRKKGNVVVKVTG